MDGPLYAVAADSNQLWAWLQLGWPGNWVLQQGLLLVAGLRAVFPCAAGAGTCTGGGYLSVLQCPWGPPWPLHVSAPLYRALPPPNHLNLEMIGYLISQIIHYLGINTSISDCPEEGLGMGKGMPFFCKV